MKFAWPESQNRVLLKWGNIDSVSAMASLGGLGGSLTSGGAGVAVWVEVETVCDCAQPVGAAKPSTKVSARATARAEARCPPDRSVVEPSTMKTNFNINIMRSN